MRVAHSASPFSPPNITLCRPLSLTPWLRSSSRKPRIFSFCFVLPQLSQTSVRPSWNRVESDFYDGLTSKKQLHFSSLLSLEREKEQEMWSFFFSSSWSQKMRKKGEGGKELRDGGVDNHLSLPPSCENKEKSSLFSRLSPHTS